MGGNTSRQDNCRSLTWEGNDYREKNDSKKALECYDRAIDIDNCNTVPYEQKGKLLFKLQRYNEALFCYDKIIQLNGEHGVPRLYPRTYYDKGLAHHMLNEYNRAKNSFNDAIEVNERWLRISPERAKKDMAEFYHWNGNAHLELREYKEALDYYNKSLALESKNAWAHFNKGVVYSHQNNYRDAISCYEDAIRLDSKQTKFHSGKGEALHSLERYQDALTSYNEAIQLGGRGDHQNHYMKGDTYFHLGNYPQALSSYNDAITLKNNDSHYHSIKGKVLCWLERYEDAILSYNNAIIHARGAESYYYCNKGDALFCLMRHEEALDCFKKAIELNPEWIEPFSYEGQGLIYLSRQDYKNAALFFDKVLQLNNNNASAYNGKANLLYRQNQYQLAWETFKKSNEIKVNDNGHHHFSSLNKIYPDYLPPALGEQCAKALFLCELHQYPEALRELEAAQKISSDGTIKKVIKPSMAQVLSTWSTQLKRARNYQQAQEKYAQALQLEPTHVNSLLGSADIVLITNSLFSGSVPSSINTAQSDCKESVLNDEKSSTTILQAKKYYEQVLEKDPSCIRAQHNLAVLYRRNGDEKAAVTYYEKIIKKHQDYWPSYFNLACLLARDIKQHQYANTVFDTYLIKNRSLVGISSLDVIYESVDDLQPSGLISKLKHESERLKSQQIIQEMSLFQQENTELLKKQAIKLTLLPDTSQIKEDIKEARDEKKGADDKHSTQASKNEEVFQAVRANDLNKLKLLKLQGFDLNINGYRDNSLLHIAAEFSGGEELLNYLVTECGFGIDKQNHEGETALYLAVRSGHISVVEYLVKKGASLALQYGAEKLTIIAFALKHGCSSILLDKLLIGSDVNYPAPGNKPVLHLAASFGNIDVISWLITKKRANVNMLDEKEMSPLAHAVLKGQEPAVRILLASPLNASFNDQSNSGKQLLESLDKSDLSVEIKAKVKTHLFNHVANQKRQQELCEKRSKQLSEAIFLALFADITSLPSDAKKGVTYDKSELSTTNKLLRLIFNAFYTLPEDEFTLLTTKLDLEKREVKLSQEGQRFIDFTRYRLMEERATKKKTFLSEMSKIPLRAKWYSALEKDSKKQDNFSHQIQSVTREFVNKNEKTIILENFVNAVIIGLGFKETIMVSLFKAKFKEMLMTNERLNSIYSGGEAPSKLVTLLIKELQLSLKEDNEIKEPHKELIYNSRVKIAIWDWLDTTNQLQELEKRFYVLAKEIQSQLDQLRNRKSISDKKPSIERLLILEILLEYSEKEDLLKGTMPKDAKSKDASNFIEYIAQKKYSLETTTDKNIKDKSYEGLSRNVANQKGYKNTLNKIISDWWVETNRQEYSVSRGPSISVSIASPENKSPLTNQEVKLSTKQELFVTNFCQEFERFYCMYKAINFDLVRRREEKIDQVAEIARHYEHVTLDVQGVNVPVGMVGSFVMKLLVWRKDNNIKEAAARIGWIFGSRLMEENARYIRFAAEYIAYRHQMQIELLTTESIPVVGICAADRAIQFITASDANLIVTQASFLSRMWENIKQSMAYKKYAPMLLPEFKGPISAVIDGVIEGESEKDRATSVSTIKGHTWAPGGIFRNVGFMVRSENGETNLYRHPKLVTISDKNIDHKEHGSLVYGYCWVRPEELELAIKHGYVKDDKTSLVEVFKHFPDPSAPLLPKSPPSNPMFRK